MNDPSARGPVERPWLLFAALAFSLISVAESTLLLARPSPRRAASPAVALPILTGAADPCAELGVRFTMDGKETRVAADLERDRAGHKFQRSRSRSTWVTAYGGPAYVHAVGAAAATHLGESELSLLTIKPAQGHDAYALARGAHGVLQITRADGQVIGGRFEANVSPVSDTTREPPPGTPVSHVRGSFCLPAHADDLSDTGP
jgi:hypothetical protein